MNKKLCRLLGSLAAVVISLPALADTSTSTLDKIRQTGTITIGHRETSIPFSFIEGNKPIGYSIDICLAVVDALKVTLKKPDLQVKYQLINGENRFPMTQSGNLDLECGSTTNNVERQKIVAFSMTTFVAGTRLMSKKSSRIRSLVDLRNKTVVGVSGTTNLQQLTEFNNKHKYDITIIEVTEDMEAIDMVKNGRAAAFVMDDVILASYIASMDKPEDYALSSQALSVEPYGMMMRRDDPAFKKIVDDVIVGLFRSGKINEIYSKWFMAPIPPKGINLKVQMDPRLQKVIKNPTDSSNPVKYLN